MVSVYPLGTTIYRPEKCDNGYTLVGTSPRGFELLDMNGTVVHRWQHRGEQFYHYQLLDNGHLVLQETEWDDAERIGLGQGHLREYDWDGSLVWELTLPQRYFSCSISERLDNGNTLTGAKETIPATEKSRIDDPRLRSIEPILSDVLLEVTPAGDVVWEWHAYQHLDLNRYFAADSFDLPGGWNWTHFNCLQALPENRWYDEGDERFRPGNVLVSPRTLGSIFIIDRQSGDVVWEYQGDYMGGLAGQHCPRMVPKGTPGEGNIVLVDNGSPPIREIMHTARTFILEVNPVAKQVEWIYREDAYLRFYVPFAGDVQRLKNGNTLITENFGSRIFEVTRDGEIVWEYALPAEGLSVHGYRHPYDHCPQMAGLPRASEEPVAPPPHVDTTSAAAEMQAFDLASQQKG